MQAYNIGVIGVGVYGCHSLEQALVSNGPGKIISVCSNDSFGAGCYGSSLEKEARIYAAKFNASFQSDWRVVVNDPQIDIVSVMVCPSKKAEIICAALRAGKHVVTDKPLAMTVEEAEAVCLAEKESGKSGFMLAGYHTRPLVKTLIEAVRCGELGELKAVSIRLCFMGGIFPGFIPSLLWRKEIPAAEMITIGSHAIITLLKLTGGKVRKVCAVRKFDFYENYHQVNAEDWATLNCMFDSGTVANIKVGRIPHRVPGDDISIEVTGTEGYAQISGDLLKIHPSGKAIRIPIDGGKILNDTFSEYYSCLAEGKPMPVSFSSGLEIQKILAAALK
jgi:predicted dehydrogenase